MIRVTLEGGLGNWLFQYAVGRRLADARGTGLVLDCSRQTSLADPTARRVRRLLGFFRHRTRFDSGWLRRLRPAGPTWREPAWGFHPEVLDLPDGVTLDGYFQSERYFAGSAATLRRELQPRRPPATADARALLAEINRGESVSVHVRRGDYLRKPLHRVCGRDYFVRCAELLRARLDNPRFFVFSDDLAWCRAELGIAPVTYVELPSAAGDPGLEMYLMSRCRHHVIANSTFSWWGAWLDERPDKSVLAPGRWFNHPEMDAAALRDTVPCAWERVACTPPAEA